MFPVVRFLKINKDTLLFPLPHRIQAAAAAEDLLLRAQCPTMWLGALYALVVHV